MSRPTSCDAVRVTRETGHVCWVVEDGDDYAAVMDALFADAASSGRKCVAFGPGFDSSRAPSAAIAADPAVAFLGGGALEPSTMFAMFREQDALARSEGYGGLCVVADMDWVRATGATAGDVVAFELLLDAVVRELGAHVVCAYRRATYADPDVRGVLCVHPGALGAAEEAPFTLVAAEPGCWRLSGEVDLATTSAFGAAVDAALVEGTAIDATALTFIDVAGMRALAHAAKTATHPVELRNVRPALGRWWSAGHFDVVAPNVTVATTSARRAS